MLPINMYPMKVKIVRAPHGGTGRAHAGRRAARAGGGGRGHGLRVRRGQTGPDARAADPAVRRPGGPQTRRSADPAARSPCALRNFNTHPRPRFRGAFRASLFACCACRACLLELIVADAVSDDRINANGQFLNSGEGAWLRCGAVPA